MSKSKVFRHSKSWARNPGSPIPPGNWQTEVLLYATRATTIATDNLGDQFAFTPRDPSATLAAINALSWSLAGVPLDPVNGSYPNPGLSYEKPTTWDFPFNGTPFSATGIDPASGFTLMPTFNNLLSANPQYVNATFFSGWVYLSQFTGIPNGTPVDPKWVTATAVWGNEITTKRERFRFVGPFSGFVLGMELHTSIDGINPGGDAGPSDYNYLVGTNFKSIAQIAGAPNTFFEIPPISIEKPADGHTFVGRLYLAVLGETNAQWSQRTGYPLG